MTDSQLPASSRNEDAERRTLIDRMIRLQESSEDLQLSETVTTLLTVPLTIKQLKVLGLIIAGHGTASSQRLATTLDVSLATISGIIDRLVSHGMVERAENEHDLRVRNLVATPQGDALLKDLIASSHQIRDEALGSLKIENLRALVQGLEAFGRAIQNASE